MAKAVKHIDISDVPDLLRLVEEVRQSNKPQVLSRDDEDLAILVPIATRTRHARRRASTPEEDAVFLSAAGSWKGIVDTEALLKSIREGRGSSRPPVEL